MQRPFVELFSGGDGGRSIKEGPRPREGRGGERGEGKAARCGVAWWRGGGSFRSLSAPPTTTLQCLLGKRRVGRKFYF